MSEIVAFLNLLSIPAQAVALMAGVFLLWKISTHTKSQAIHQEYTNKKLDEHAEQFLKQNCTLQDHSEKLMALTVEQRQHREWLLNLKDKI